MKLQNLKPNDRFIYKNETYKIPFPDHNSIVQNSIKVFNLNTGRILYLKPYLNVKRFTD